MRSTAWLSPTFRAPAAMLLVVAAVLSGCRDRKSPEASRATKSRPTIASARAALAADGDAGPGAPAAGDLELKHTLYSPTRIAEGPDGKLYVSDTSTNSVFIYRNLLPEGELKGLAKPLGVAVDGQGNLYVGNDERDNIEVYDSSGVKLRDIGSGAVQMPNDLALDRDGNLFVADSRANAVVVFGPDGALLRTIGSALLQYPVALGLGYRGSGGAGEIYVADQGHAAIQVFDFAGTFLRAFGVRLELGVTAWHGKFVQLQSVGVDAQGHIHVLDTALNCIQIFEPLTGAYLDSYGRFGMAEGQLNLPLDIAVTRANQVMVANSGNHRIETIRDLNR